MLSPIEATSHYLSRIPGRSPTEKLHSQLGHAKSAVNNYFNGYKGYGVVSSEHTGSEMEIYELVDIGWKLLYSIKRGDVELPWKAGELEKRLEEKREQERKEQLLETLKIASEACKAYDEACDSGNECDVSAFFYGFEKGFRKANEIHGK